MCKRNREKKRNCYKSGKYENFAIGKNVYMYYYTHKMTWRRACIVHSAMPSCTLYCMLYVQY